MAETALDRLMPGPDALARIRAEIDGYNAERPRVARQAQMRLAAYFAGWALVSAAICWPLVVGGYGRMFGLACVAILFSGYFLYDRAIAARDGFRQTLRDRLLPSLFGFVDDLRYSSNGSSRFLERMPGNEFLRRTDSRHRDLLSGTHEGFAFTLCETELSVGSGSKREVTFDGVIVAFQQENGFPGTLLAARRPGRLAKAIRGLFDDGRLTEIKSGDDGIDASHEFRSDDPQSAMPRVAAMAKALDYLSDVWPEGVVRIAVRHKDGFLLVPTKKDFFELPPIGVPLDFERHVQPMIADLMTLLATARLVSRI
ncbi:hypothetical protein C0075_13000 [Rhizobium sp. KAs_5_22]|nr:hypothetical protein C0075_13000 [Rhizobium sp. KAs_5_22]